MRHNGGTRRPEEIQAEIDRTRGEMDRTLSAIEQRLTPGQLVDQSLDYLRNSGATEFAQNLGGAAKNNPLPVALVGIGLAWLMALGRQPAQHQGSFAYGSGAASGMRESMDAMKDRASESMSSMRERAGHMTDSARHQWERARGGLDYLVHEQPLALGAIGLAIGAVLGGLAPRTRKEEELMGEASRSMIDKTKETAKDVAERVKAESKPDGQPQMRNEPQSSGKTASPPSTPTTPRPPRQGL